MERERERDPGFPQESWIKWEEARACLVVQGSSSSPSALEFDLAWAPLILSLFRSLEQLPICFLIPGAAGKQAVPSLTYPLRRPFLQAQESLGYAVICLIAFLPRSWLFFFMSNCEVVE